MNKSVKKELGFFGLALTKWQYAAWGAVIALVAFSVPVALLSLDGWRLGAFCALLVFLALWPGYLLFSALPDAEDRD